MAPPTNTSAAPRLPFVVREGDLLALRSRLALAREGRLQMVALGGGPGVSMNKDQRRLNTSMIVAGGATAPFGDLFIPVHVAVALARGGPRITTLFGWIVG